MPYLDIEKQRKAQREYYYRNREAVQARTEEWRKNNPDVILAVKAIRRAKKAKAYSLLSKEEKLKCRSFYAQSKKLSKENEGKTKYVVDHIVPISKEGKHHPNNLQVVPDVWNSHKGNKLWGKYKGRL
jgi:5-methylcytosine-specific restriction endonuclease McrA